jgi:hypothetical protein
MAKKQKHHPKKIVRLDALKQINFHAAGIDVGDSEMYVAVPEDRDQQFVRVFGTFTRDLVSIAQWLLQCNITTVAMESTGVYWIPLFEILVEYGFEVLLVDARKIKNVSGRKTDVEDCQWILPKAWLRQTTPYLWTSQRFVYSRSTYSCSARHDPAPGKSAALSGISHPTYAENSSTDESQTHQRPERYYRHNRYAHPARHR